MKSLPLLLFIALLLGLSGGCTRGNPASDALRRAEAVMDSCPDSALVIVRSVSPDSLTSQADRSLHSLLLAQALDKNYLPLPPDSLLEASLGYFTDCGDRRRAMLASLYLGKVLAARSDASDALVCFFRSRDIARELDDPFWGAMAARGIADIWHSNFNFGEEIEYTRQELDLFRRAARQPYVDYALLDYARALSSGSRYDESCAIVCALADSARAHSDSILAVEAARISGINLIVRGDYLRARSAFASLSASSMASASDSLYFYLASVLSGLPVNPLAVQSVSVTDSLDAPLKHQALYLIHTRNGNHEDALREYRLMNAINNRAVSSRMNRDLASAVISRYDLLNRLAESEMKATRTSSVLVLVIALFLISALIVAFFILRARYLRNIDSKLQLACDFREQLSRSSTLVAGLISSHNSVLNRLLTADPDDPSSRRKIATAVSSLLGDIAVGGPGISRLSQEIDLAYSNLYSDFVKAVPGLKDSDRHLFLFSAYGFTPSVIARLLRVPKITSVYDRKRRLKDRIRRLPPHLADRFLSFLN